MRVDITLSPSDFFTSLDELSAKLGYKVHGETETINVTTGLTPTHYTVRHYFIEIDNDEELVILRLKFPEYLKTGGRKFTLKTT